MELMINGKPQRLSDQLTVADLVQQLELQPKQVAVEVNLQLVPRQEHASYQLSAGDEVEIVTLVGGG
jgi:thiamine biosynthesis protein ThiS